MNVGWLIDGDMFANYRDDLVSAIRHQGHDVKLVHAPNPPFRWDDVGCSYRETFPENSCVISLGDIGLMSRIHREKRWIPGAFCSVENYFCSKYLCTLGSYWLNRDYAMVPFGELSRQRKFLFDTFGSNGRIFVRPDSPLKLFAGQIATHENFDADIEFMGFYDFPPESIVVVSTPKTVTCEWRFVVAGGRIVAGSQYSRNGNMELNAKYSPDAHSLASSIAALDFAPDPAWIIDICTTDDEQYHLMEIGGFSFSDLYACDKSEVVEAVSQEALKVWEASIA